MPLRGRPRSLVSEQAILDATLRILSTEGYAALTVDRVASLARASKATLYRRWKTKEHLVLAVFSRMPVVVPEEGRNVEDELLGMFSQFSRQMRDSPLKGVLPMLAAECVGNPTLSTTLMLINDQRRGPVRLVLRRGIQRGELPPDTDIELAIDLIQGAVAIRIYFLLENPDELWMRRLLRVVLAGLRAKPR
ncbi:TetR family transcriptional regulator [Panacagrimonas perspica]|uniref:TetR family transcriptional regulator n=1 Tax=Panacagrimonas perspica TaxID=381431 RepID=A0A4S3K0D7_9GAMM|nr:TetR family transcriptional regulator [Panacagrimonas perspica]THD01375.1 hypothetical protein B1810_19710 [Panacagrimonas perspica]